MITTMVGGTKFRELLIKSYESVTCIDNVREDDEAAQLNAVFKVGGWDGVLLATIGADEKLRAGIAELEKSVIVEVPHPFIDKIEINVDARAKPLLTETCNRCDVRVWRGCG
jgi:hypothetical protein